MNISKLVTLFMLGCIACLSPLLHASQQSTPVIVAMGEFDGSGQLINSYNILSASTGSNSYTTVTFEVSVDLPYFVTTGGGAPFASEISNKTSSGFDIRGVAMPDNGQPIARTPQGIDFVVHSTPPAGPTEIAKITLSADGKSLTSWSGNMLPPTPANGPQETHWKQDFGHIGWVVYTSGEFSGTDYSKYYVKSLTSNLVPTESGASVYQGDSYWYFNCRNDAGTRVDCNGGTFRLIYDPGL